MAEAARDIEALLTEQKRLVATEHQEEAWADARLAGIEAEIIAEAAIETAFYELVGESGEEAALHLLETMREKVLSGAFLGEMTSH